MELYETEEKVLTSAPSCPSMAATAFSVIMDAMSTSSLSRPAEEGARRSAGRTERVMTSDVPVPGNPGTCGLKAEVADGYAGLLCCLCCFEVSAQ